MFNDLNASGVGVVIKNDKGEFIAALSKHIPFRMKATFVESVAALNAVIFSHDCGFPNVVFELDVLTAIKIILSNDSFAGPYGHIIDDIQKESRYFRFCNWSFVCGNGNEVVHCLAKQAKVVSNFES